MEGITLSKLLVEAGGHIDFSKFFGLMENPIVKEVKFKVTAASDTELEKIEYIRRRAEERCPAVYCLTKPIKVTTELREN